jgi:hypothetical protein
MLLKKTLTPAGIPLLPGAGAAALAIEYGVIIRRGIEGFIR